MRDHGPAKPQQQVYVLDLEARTVKTFPVPLAAHGVSFSPDGHALAVGGHQTNAP